MSDDDIFHSDLSNNIEIKIINIRTNPSRALFLATPRRALQQNPTLDTIFDFNCV